MSRFRRIPKMRNPTSCRLRFNLRQVCRGELWKCAALLSLVFVLSGPARGDGHTAPMKIAVFDFELDDHSAGGGIIPEDDIDRANLKQSTQEAKRELSANSRYKIVDTSGVAAEIAARNGVLNCNSCEVEIARRLGADEALIGVITRVNRTEYTLFMRVKNTSTGAETATGFTGLRLGANYAWARGVTWLMTNQMLAKLAPRGK